MSTTTGRLNWPFAAPWAVATFIGWLATAVTIAPQVEASYYLLAGIFAQIVTLALRWRLICNRDRISARTDPVEGSPENSTVPGWLSAMATGDHEVTWILCWVSQLYILGCVMLGPGLIATLALAAAIMPTEILLLRFAPPSWNAALPSWWPHPGQAPSLPGLDCVGQAESLSDFNAERAESPSFESDDDLESEFESEKLSATFHGLTEDGQPYVQGWQRYELAAGQKSTSLTIGFFPPFMSVPDCELDHEGDEEVHYEIEHITPAGVRVMLKRRRVDECAVGKILWHSSWSAEAETPLSGPPSDFIEAHS